MAQTEKMGIRQALYEKSPKENLEVVRRIATKYKPALQWVVPVVIVYSAYKVLNSKDSELSINNISEACEEKLGFKLEFLENKKALKELMAIGGICAGAYGIVKATSTIFAGNNGEKNDVSVEEIEGGMSKLDAVSKKFAWLKPKVEDMLPIAFSVIFVSVALHKPMFSGKIADKVRDLSENLRIKLGTYKDLCLLFIQEKFNIDLSTDDAKKKMILFASLASMVGILAFLYGKKILKKDSNAEDEKKENKVVVDAKKFVEQAKKIMEKIAPTAFTTLISLLVSTKIIDSSDGIIEVSFTSSEDHEECEEGVNDGNNPKQDASEEETPEQE